MGQPCLIDAQKNISRGVKKDTGSKSQFKICNKMKRKPTRKLKIE